MKTILLATDFSSAALNAANYATDMALAIDADILLQHVYSIPASYSELPAPVNIEEIKLDAEENINELKEKLIRKTGGKLKIESEVRMGTFFYELKTVCESIEPYTVVMGSQGTTASERLFFGGHTIYAMKHLMWPLITVPRGARFSRIKKIGLACDFEIVDNTPVEEIKKLVKDFNAELHVLITGSREEFDPKIVFESGLLIEMMAPLNHEYHFITTENIDEGIMDFSEKNNIDLLIVLPRRHSLLDKIIHRSHTKQLVLHSHVPVMALHNEIF